MNKFRPNGLENSQSLLKAKYVEVKKRLPSNDQIQGPSRKILYALKVKLRV